MEKVLNTETVGLATHKSHVKLDFRLKLTLPS